VKNVEAEETARLNQTSSTDLSSKNDTKPKSTVKGKGRPKKSCRKPDNRTATKQSENPLDTKKGTTAKKERLCAMKRRGQKNRTPERASNWPGPNRGIGKVQGTLTKKTKTLLSKWNRETLTAENPRTGESWKDKEQAKKVTHSEKIVWCQGLN